MKTQPLYRFTLFLITALTAALFIGCDWYDDDDNDNDPPDGQGAIIVDNDTFNDVRVFIDGERREDTRDRKSKAYNLDPGTYRLVLDEKGGDRNFRGDIDVLENRNTIVNIANRGSATRYDVAIFFD